MLRRAVRQIVGGQRSAIPEAALYLLDVFQQLCATRTFHAAGPNPIAFAEIEAWARLMRVPLEPHHVALLRAMDDEWMSCARERQAAPEGVRALPPRSDQPITPELLDAMMG